MKTYVCQACKYIALNGAPVDCPVCGMAIENFENDPDAIKKPVDTGNLTEAEKKHIPKVFIAGECPLNHADKCTGIRIKVGDIEHVMEAEHFITFIDLYIDEKYLSRVILTPQKIHPAAELHLNINAGKLTVIANCNVHGNWMTRINLDNTS